MLFLSCTYVKLNAICSCSWTNRSFFKANILQGEEGHYISRGGQQTSKCHSKTNSLPLLVLSQESQRWTESKSVSQYACLLCTVAAVANLILLRHSKSFKVPTRKPASTRIIQNLFYTPFSGYQLRARRFRQILAKAICLSQNSTGNDEDQWKKKQRFNS